MQYPSDAEIGYTNPVTGETMTRAELRADSQGVWDPEAGCKAYFRPSFVADPWAKFEAEIAKGEEVVVAAMEVVKEEGEDEAVVVKKREEAESGSSEDGGVKLDME